MASNRPAFSSSLLCSSYSAALFLLFLFHGAAGRLIKDPPLVLDYHNGELLAGTGSLNVYTIWYGDFAASDKAVISDFFSSFADQTKNKQPSVSSWWGVTSGYKDHAGSSIFPSVRNTATLSIPHTTGSTKVLKSADLESLLDSALKSGTFPADPKALYLILTAPDVPIEGFCVQSCATHKTLNTPNTKNTPIVYAWIGNSATQCPGKCAWPYANPRDFGGPDMNPLVAPNGIGVDGMIINIATMVAGASSNPFGNGYFQGSASAPLEAVTACPGMFGQGSYPGYPGKLLTDAKSGASFNAYGFNNREFLLPALWNPSTSACAYP